MDWNPFYAAFRMAMPTDVQIQTYTDEFGGTAFRMTRVIFGMKFTLTTTISKFEMLQLRAEDRDYYVANIMAAEARRRWDHELADHQPFRQLHLLAPTPLR